MKKNKNNLISISPPAPPVSSVPIPPEPPVAEKVPPKYYSNLDTCKVKILSDNKNKSGIYMFQNLKNGKRYLGSELRSKICKKKRFMEYLNVNHLLKNICMNICKALVKHGYSNFSLIILEYCEPSKCLEREAFYQKTFNPEYNIAKEPGAPMSGRKHSDKSKQIMSDTAKKIDNSGRYKPGENHPNYGKNLSDETKQIMSPSPHLGG